MKFQKIEVLVLGYDYFPFFIEYKNSLFFLCITEHKRQRCFLSPSKPDKILVKDSFKVGKPLRTQHGRF